MFEIDDHKLYRSALVIASVELATLPVDGNELLLRLDGWWSLSTWLLTEPCRPEGQPPQRLRDRES